MATSSMTGVLQLLRRILGDGAGLSDGQLLDDYLRDRDDAAFAALVRRHGPMVWGVCRRVLGEHHAVEDAFQATFLVFVRKAASIASRELVANWLYGVAHQTALKARATAAKRKGRERQVTPMPEPAATQHDPWRDLQPVLDEELSRLPDKYRGVIVLCDLEGKTRREAAEQLGCAEGTIASRLARARTMLAKRLTRRGVALSGGALAAALTQQTASASVPTLVLDATIKAASVLVAGQTAGAVSGNVAVLMEGVMKAMLLKKLKTVFAVLLMLGVLTAGATFLASPRAAGQDEKKPIVEKAVKPAQKGEKLDPAVEGQLKWGEPVGGLRGALAARGGVGGVGEVPDLYLALQNVSPAPLRVTDADVPKNVNLRMLNLQILGEIKYGLGVREPGLGDVVLQPREVVFLPVFSLDSKTSGGLTIGQEHVSAMLKDATHVLIARFTIEKSTAGGWTGELRTGPLTSGAPVRKAETIEPAAEKKLQWGEPVNGLRGALAIRSEAGAVPEVHLVLQNVSPGPLRVSDTDPANAERWLREGRNGLGSHEPKLGDIMVQSREVVFVPFFSSKSKIADGLLGQKLAAGALKSKRPVFAEFKIDKSPAGAWTGELRTPDLSQLGTGVLELEIQSTSPPAANR